MRKFFDFSLDNYDAEYYRIYEKAWKTNLDQIPSFRLINQYLNPQAGEYILDAGCGTGHLLNHTLSGSEANGYGIDFSGAALEIASRRYPMFRFMQTDLRAIALRDRSLDKITCFNVIEHIAEQDAVMEEFKRILKRGGLLVIGTNIRDSIAWRLYQFFIGEHTHIREFNVEEFVAFLGRHFDVLTFKKSSGVFRFGPPISWIFHHLLLGDILALCRNRT